MNNKNNDNNINSLLPNNDIILDLTWVEKQLHILNVLI